LAAHLAGGASTNENYLMRIHPITGIMDENHEAAKIMDPRQ
jgi:hypothetical protein